MPGESLNDYGIRGSVGHALPIGDDNIPRTNAQAR